MRSERLLEIAKLVGEDSIVLDVGTDHGYIPVYLIEEGRSKKLIGSDISKGSLEKIKSFVRMKGLEDKIDCRLGDGLDVIRPYEVDTVIIAGMGGVLIEEILRKDWEKTESINNFILQPMIGAKELRKYLINNKFEIVDNKLLKEDGKYYEIIHARIGKSFIKDDFEYEIPSQFIEEEHPLLKEYIEEKLRYSENIYNNIKDKDTESVRERLEELEIDIRNYREVLDKIEG